MLPFGHDEETHLFHRCGRPGIARMPARLRWTRRRSRSASSSPIPDSDASIGEAIDRGAELYLTLHRSELPPGVELQLIKRDETGPTPDVAKRLARELIVREGVQILTGGQWTPNVSAIAPLATEAGIPYVVMSSGTASTTRLSPFIVRVAFTTWQHSYHMGKWAAMNGITRASTIVSDYAAGVDAEEAFVPGFKDGGGTIVSSVRAPLRNGRLRAVPGAHPARQASGAVRVQPRGAGSHAVHQGVRRSWTGGGGHPADRTECDRPRR